MEARKECWEMSCFSELGRREGKNTEGEEREKGRKGRRERGKRKREWKI